MLNRDADATAAIGRWIDIQGVACRLYPNLIENHTVLLIISVKERQRSRNCEILWVVGDICGGVIAE